MVLSSVSPWANWHLSPYLQVPFSWKGRHNSVLYLLELMATPELDLLPAVEEPEDDEAEDEGMELKRNIIIDELQET